MSQPPSRGRLAPRGGRRPAAAAETPASGSSATPVATPAPASAAPSTSTSSAATPVASSAAKPGLKFKPKAVRRGEAERQRIAEEQQRLQDIRNEQESRRLARANRGRGRGGGRGRGRGNFLMRGGRTASAAGPLSGGMGYGGGSSGFDGGGADGFGTSNGFDANRINADMLYSLSLEDEEEKLENGLVRTKKKRAPMPMGIRRFEHEEEEVVMATAAEIEAQDAGVDVAAGDNDNDDDNSSDLFVDNGEGPVQIKDEGAVDTAVPRTIIKKEGGEMEDVNMESIPEGVIKTPESPELKKKVMATTKEAEKPKEKKPKKPKETEADFAQQDRERLVELFNHGTELEGHMFLFQLPVVLPPLKSAAPAPKVKPEPENDDVMMLDQPAMPKSSSRIDLTSEEASKVKKENGEEADADTEQEDMTREGGYVGQLVVRKSGKVEVSWGGVPLQMGLGIQANFLSTAVIIKEDDVKPTQDQYTGAAYGMGRIQGSFVLAHTFGDEEEWVVDPSELVIVDGEQ
ncbi:RNA polymerase III RPC4-domain-containing protein [Neurospora hispaniola]|uniref:RNA polymerase III RPC4-domain-containing protein n=1 Tax=Neurospora hispaniola TaxID=588809 RepID=A0AAJ0IFV0_9PEZI|nr:RNA polymerase III RPC4-domain-containing protein [Neurospora hispaniola]